MPSGLAEAARQQLARTDKTGLVLERSPYSMSGFKNIIEVKGGKYQARVHGKAPPGCQRKRKQYSLPGLFDTAQEAAEYLAVIKRIGVEELFGEDGVPPKQSAERKARSKPPDAAPAATLPPQPRPMAIAMAVPIPFSMHAPLVAVSPLPVKALSFAPPTCVPVARLS